MSSSERLDLDAIRKRCDGASAGPWRECADFLPLVEDGTGYRFAQVDDGGNREFIAAARFDIPALLAEVERLRAENAELGAYINNLANGAL